MGSLCSKHEKSNYSACFVDYDDGLVCFLIKKIFKSTTGEPGLFENLLEFGWSKAVLSGDSDTLALSSMAFWRF